MAQTNFRLKKNVLQMQGVLSEATTGSLGARDFVDMVTITIHDMPPFGRSWAPHAVAGQGSATSSWTDFLGCK